MTYDVDNPGLGHNAPPLADQLAIAYSVTQLAEDHAPLAGQVAALVAQAAGIVAVDNPDDNQVAAAAVIALRDLTKIVDDTHDDVKAPVLNAGRNVDAFFSGLNTSTGPRFGPLTGHKRRIEALISGYGFRVAEEQRRIAREAAEVERKKAQAAADAAAAQEAANKPQVAEIILDSAMKTERIADALDQRASGPVQEVARTRTPVATTGVRSQRGFAVEDVAALRASLGPLGASFTADALAAALRKYRGDSEAFAEWKFRDDDQHAQRRVVVPAQPIPGVVFFIDYLGSVRA
jgi:hypothetical protein